MEINKNKNGPLDVVRITRVSEQDYRALNALSYSRLSDIERIGISAVNAPAGNITHLRGINLGSIVDDVISNRRSLIPPNIHPINKFPTVGSITHKISLSIVKNLNFTSFSDLSEEEIIDLATKEGLFANGINATNIYSRITNFYEFINVLKAGVDEKDLINKFDYTIVEKAIKRLRRIDYFSENFKGKKFTFGNLNNRHIEYQAMFLATVNGIQFKCMIDALLFDHVNKKIYPIDIKTGAMYRDDFISFFEECYCYYNYYIQSGIYKTIVAEYFKYHSNYKNYTVADFEFVYSTTNPKFALRIEKCFKFTIDADMHLASFKGFKTTNFNGTNKNKPAKQGIVELFNIYKDNVINPSKREDLIKFIESIEELPF